MKAFRNIIRNTSRLFTQGPEERRARAAMEGLRELGYPLYEIRMAIYKLHGIRLTDLANGIARPTLYSVMRGDRHTPKAQEILSDAVGLSVDEFFPADDA